jgi:hypothetical protein
LGRVAKSVNKFEIPPLKKYLSDDCENTYIWSMLTKIDILSKLKELKPELHKDYSVREIGLFGSFSDGSDTEESDIDILVELERPIGWKILTLEIYLEKIFGRKIDLVTKNALKEQIKESILKQVNYA